MTDLVRHESKWTQFWDMHSGGGRKEGFDMLYIEAPEDQAVSVFYARFGHSPHRVTCTCCGADYSITESDSLEELTAYHRRLRHIESLTEKTEYGYPVSKYIEPHEVIPDGWRMSRYHFHVETPLNSEDKRKIALLQAKADDKAVTPDERDAFLQKIEEIKAKRGLNGITLEEYLANGNRDHPDVVVIRADEIRTEERTRQVPEQGYVWRD